MAKELLYEEIERIRLLFGESLLYGNLNDNFNLITEQGRYFKKVWDDFAIKNPTAAKKFDDVSINRFKNTDIKSFDDFFKHLEINKSMWEAIGIPSLDLTTTIKLKKLIMDGNDPSLLFRKSGSNRYFYEFIPVDGNIRGEFFYWFSKKYPDEWLKGLKSIELDDVADTKLTNVKALGGEEIKVDVNNQNDELLPAVKSEVRVDSEGRCLDFNKDGAPIDKNGKLIEWDIETGKPKGDNFLPVVDDGGRINFEADPDPYTTDEPGIRRFIGDMEGREWNSRVKRAKAANYFSYWIDRLMPKVSELYKQVFSKKNYEAARVKFNDLIFDEMKNALAGDAVTAPGNIARIKGNINDAFIDFYRTLENDPDFNNLNFNGVWEEMLNEFDRTVVGLTPQERGKCKAYLEQIKNEVEADLLLDGYIKPSGRPNIAEYIGEIKQSEKGPAARVIDQYVIFYKKCIIDILPFSKKDTFWADLYNVSVTLIQTLVRPAWNTFIRGSIFNPKAIKLFLGTQSKIGKYTLRPFSRAKYIALIVRNLVMTKLIFPFIQALYIATVEFSLKAVEVKTGANTSEAGKGVGWWSLFGKNLMSEFTEEIKGSSENTIMDTVVQWIPGYWDDLALWASGIAEEDASGKGKEPKDYIDKAKKRANEMGLDQNIMENGEAIVGAELERSKIATANWNTMKDALGTWVGDEGREDLKPNARKLEKLLKPNTHIIKSMEEVNSEVKNVNPEFKLDGKKYYVIINPTSMPTIRSEDGSEQNLIQFLVYKKSSLDKIEESIRYYKNIIMENEGKKFGEDNFKHWNDTFVFKTEDKGKPGQYKEVKIKMEDVMDRIDHYRKKYDEDDAFVRAVVDTHEDVVKIMYTKGLADIHESATPRGLALVLRALNESRGEMEIFSVARPANGNWFLVKGDYTQSQLANMDLEKKEPEDKEKKKDISGSEELKKKEETAINTLKSNEREGLDGLPKKVREKVLEKMGKGWTTETPPSFLEKLVEKSHINTIFNDRIDIFKLDSNDDTFDTIVDNSSRIFIKRGFCRSLYVAAENASLNNKQEMVVNHILKKCDTKFAGKLGVRNF